jgi:hypothetical protein
VSLQLHRLAYFMAHKTQDFGTGIFQPHILSNTALCNGENVVFSFIRHVAVVVLTCILSRSRTLKDQSIILLHIKGMY